MKLIVNNVTFDQIKAIAVYLDRDTKDVDDKAKKHGKKVKTRAEIIADFKKKK